MDSLFDIELAKHPSQVELIEQNLAAQQNILLALTDAYAKLSGCRKQIVEAFRKRDQIISALIASYDAYEDLLAKANKGIDFYQKLETNVNKLLQRLRSTCRVQEEEREQKNASITPQNPTPLQNTVTPTTPKLRDYLQQPVGVRPAPLGSEHTDIGKPIDLRNPLYGVSQYPGVPNGAQNYPYQVPRVSTPQNFPPNSIPINYQMPISSGYQMPSTAGQNYQASSVSSPVNQPPMSFSKPQNEQGPQVTPAMPQYQVAPQQYPQNINTQQQNIPGYQNYVSGNIPQYLASQGKNVNYSQYPTAQSPTSQNYQIRNAIPQVYQPGNISQYPGMGYQNVVPPTTQAGQNSQYSGSQTQNPQVKPEYPTVVTPQPNVSPIRNTLGQYSNSQNAYQQYQQGVLQNPVGKQADMKNTQIAYTNMQNPNLQQYPTGTNVSSQYPGSEQYPNVKNPTGYPNNYAGMMQYPNTAIAGPNQIGGNSGYSVGPPPEQKLQISAPNTHNKYDQYPNAGTPQIGPNVNQYTQNNHGQSLNNQLGQYPGMGQNQNIENQLPPTMQNMKGNVAQYPSSQINSGAGQYPNTGTPQPSNQYNSQTTSGVPKYPATVNAASPQHQNNTSPQNYPKPQANMTSPQHFSVTPSTGAPQSGNLPQNQQVRPISPYQNYPNQNPAYQTGYQPQVQNAGHMGQYQQGTQMKNVYQQPGSAFYQPNSQSYPNVQNQNNIYRPQSPYCANNAVPPNVDQRKIPSQGMYYPNTTPQTYTPNVQSKTPVKKDSNIDLLAGLDFNVTQVPLDPVKAPLNESKTENDSSEKNVNDTQANATEEPKEQINETKINQNPDRWKKERSFELDVNKLDNWVTHNLEQEIESYWKNLQKENDISNAIISVARCYPGRNRCPDSLPYDRNRFELPCPPATDDYINASKAQLSNLPPMIVTQTPLPTTIEHFWTMVAHSGTELIICLMTDAELQNAGLSEGYWRPEYGIQIRSIQVRQFWTERILGVGGKDITHLQLTTSWPSIGSGDIIAGLSDLAIDVIRRRKTTPMIIHCLTGVGRSGVISVLLEIASELLPVEGAPILVDVSKIASKLSEFRRNPLRDRLHLEFTYRAALKMARIILPAPIQEEKTTPEVTTPTPTEVKDPLEELDPLWKLKVS